MSVDYFTAGNLAVLVLSAFAGFFVSFLFTRAGGCVGTAIGAVVLAVIVVALVRGYSPFIEHITESLTAYIYFNSIGMVGFVVGVLLGLRLVRK